MMGMQPRESQSTGMQGRWMITAVDGDGQVLEVTTVECWRFSVVLVLLVQIPRRSPSDEERRRRRRGPRQNSAPSPRRRTMEIVPGGRARLPIYHPQHTPSTSDDRDSDDPYPVVAAKDQDASSRSAHIWCDRCT